MIHDILIVKKSGVRLDKFLAEKYSDISRSQLQKHIKNGNVLVNGEGKISNYRLGEMDEVKVDIDEEIVNETYLEPQNIPVNIIYEDESIVVVNKPAGMTVHPGVGNRENTLANALAYHFNKLSDINGPSRPGIVHRLDQDTSGVLVIAKDNYSHNKLAEQFSSRKVKKVYYGITWGKWKTMKGAIDEPLGRKRSDPTTYQVNIIGKDAQTNYQILEETEYFSILNYFPKTGRTHQIRAHSAHVGHPIIGDEKYGGGRSKISGYIPEISKKMDILFKSVNRHLLHALQITFTHPKTNTGVTYSADLPEDIQDAVSKIKTLNI